MCESKHHYNMAENDNITFAHAIARKMGASVVWHLLFWLRLCALPAQEQLNVAAKKLLTFTNKIKTIHQNQSPRKCILMLCLTNADSGRILITYSADAVQAARFKPYNASYYLLIDLKKNANFINIPVMIVHENLVFESVAMVS